MIPKHGCSYCGVRLSKIRRETKDSTGKVVKRGEEGLEGKTLFKGG